MGAEFRILGPLELRIDGEPVRVGGDRRRGLLARLIVARGRAVPVDVLIDDVWAGTPPPGADSTLQSHVSALRRALGGERIERAGRSYRLTVQHDELDVSLAEADVATARLRLELGDHAEAVDAVERALGRWRGQPLADVSAQPWAMAEAARCDELRMQCLETALEAHLALGHPEIAVAQAEAAVAEYPFRERLWAHLILSLYRCGRQADALRAYQRLRLQLAEGLGLDPSPQLAELERAVLRQDASLTAPGPTPVALPPRGAARQAELVSVEASGSDRRAGGASDSVEIAGEPVAESHPDPAPTGHPDVVGGPALRKSGRRPVVALVAGALVLIATTISMQLSSGEGSDRTRTPVQTDSSPVPDGPEVTASQAIATGKDPRGRTWVVEPRTSETGDVCTRLNVIGRGTSRELCEPRPTDKPFGRASFIGLTDDGELNYISWIVVSDRTARVEAISGEHDERAVAELVTDTSVGVKCAVSYVNRLQPVTFVAFDASGQQIGELRLGPVRPPDRR